ncbi:hypothetical protein AS203_04135 [Hoylesella enoeca]|uniref:Uncharacterized protein n=1 Tax=Hoylesella enoeca TaxID=76123 RepID=A0A0S2KJY5_9BACT|nr:hypothetical protein AS203_04135 [Hoylesella enoeca]
MFLPAKVGCVFQTSKQQGIAGKYREVEGKGNVFHRLAFTPFCPIFFFHRSFGVKIRRADTTLSMLFK